MEDKQNSIRTNIISTTEKDIYIDRKQVICMTKHRQKLHGTFRNIRQTGKRDKRN